MPARPFRFALDPALGLRERAVESARVALVDARRQRAEADAALAAAQAVLDGGVSRSGPTAHHFALAAAHRAALGQARDRAAALAARRADAEGRARAALAEALRRHQALETLRDEAAAEHRADALRADLLTLDDLALAGRALA